MSDQLCVERARESDLPGLIRLLDALFTQEAEFVPNADAQRRGLAAIMANPGVGAIIVLRDGTQPVGMVNLLWTVSTAYGGRVAILEDLVVSPTHRARGVGSRLLSEAIAAARAEGCLRVTLLTDRENRISQTLYEQHGFSRSTMVPYRLSLANEKGTEAAGRQPAHPFADLIDLRIEEQRLGFSSLGLDVSQEHLNPHRVVHGAVVYALADTGMGAALYPTLGAGETCATIEIKINYFRPVTQGRLTCTTQIVNRGRTIANLESRIRLGDVLVAQANGNYAILMQKTGG